MFWIRVNPPGVRAGAVDTSAASCADVLREILGCRALWWARSVPAAWRELFDALGVGDTHRVVAPFGVRAAIENAARGLGATFIEADLHPATGRPVWPSRERGPRAGSVYVLDHRYGLPYPAPSRDALTVEDATASVGGSVCGRPVGSLGEAAVVALGGPPFARARGALVVARGADLDRQLETRPDLVNLDVGAPGEWHDLWKDTRAVRDWVEGCRAAARVYTSVWLGAGLPVRGVAPEPDTEPTYSAYVALVPDPDDLRRALAGRGIESRRPLGARAVRRLADPRAVGWGGARAFNAAALQLPNHPELGLDDLLYVADAVSVHLRPHGAEGKEEGNTKSIS